MWPRLEQDLENSHFISFYHQWEPGSCNSWLLQSSTVPTMNPSIIYHTSISPTFFPHVWREVSADLNSLKHNRLRKNLTCTHPALWGSSQGAKTGDRIHSSLASQPQYPLMRTMVRSMLDIVRRHQAKRLTPKGFDWHPNFFENQRCINIYVENLHTMRTSVVSYQHSQSVGQILRYLANSCKLSTLGSWFLGVESNEATAWSRS